MGLKEKNVLVTGSSGFVGSFLTEKLLNEVSSVRCLVRKSLRNISHLEDQIDVFYGNILDETVVNEVVKDIDIVFHLAAESSVRMSLKHPRRSFEINSKGTLNLLEALRKKRDLNLFVFTSTCQVYGNPVYLPIDEKHPLKPINPYAASKASAEALCQSYFHSFEVPITILRIFNVYGPRQDPCYLIPQTIIKLLKGEEPIILGGERTRDYIYVEDVIEAIISISKKYNELTQEFNVFNIGGGKEFSNLSITQTIEKIMKSKMDINASIRVVEPNNLLKRGEIQRLRSDISKIKKTVGWYPKRRLEKGLYETILWFSSDSVSKSYRTTTYNL